MSDLISTIKKVLGETDLVLGWRRDGSTGVATPARFYNEEEAEAAIFDATCCHNLAVHLPRLKDKNVGIVAKGCDVMGIVELIVEREVEREKVRVIGVSCPGMVDVKTIWRQHGYGVTIEDDGTTLTVAGKQLDRNENLQRKCVGCRDSLPVIVDEKVGGEITASPTAALKREMNELEARFAAMSPDERGAFWDEQFERCIRCYACREACPMCYCRDVCTMQTQEPHWTRGETYSKENEMAQFIRVNHLAGRCTGCGECERACPVGIPLMLYLDEQNRVIEELFDYRAGTDLDAKPPLLTFSIESDAWGES
ncbi:MAG: 4Fe-4S dicluster domain-containing protein [Actinomycetota bacterium]